MGSRKIAVLGVYLTRAGVENAVEKLKTAGFRNTDLSVLFPHKADTKDFASEKKTTSPEDALRGAGAGAIIGGALGWIASIGILAIPGVGPFIVAGPIMAALAGAGVGGAVGGIGWALINMGIPENKAKNYEVRVKKGEILLSVHCDNWDWTEKARDILKTSGAEDISSTSEVGEKTENLAAQTV